MKMSLARLILIRLAQVLLITFLFFGLAFAGAGTLSWGRGRIVLGATLLMLAVNGAVVIPRNPEIIAERGKRHQGTKRFERAFAAVYAPAVLAFYFVGGLDAVRFGWAPLSDWTLAPGLALTALSMVPMTWAMSVNRHLESSVRIQEERGHQVVSVGPYRIVRHPMYVGMLLGFPAGALALGSSWQWLRALSA